MIQIVLEWPDATLWPNRSNGTHWATRQKAKRESKTLAFFQAHMNDVTDFDTTIDHHVEIIVHPPNRIRRDVDGLLSALKPSLDGIAQALQIDDRHFNSITIYRSENTFKGGRIVVIVE